jgi:LacI family transcriptional regulator
MHFSADEHVYKQVAESLRRDILTGRIQEKIPGERELSKRYNINFKTANKAVGMLVEQGLLSRVKGKGTFVSRRRAPPKVNLIGLIVPRLDNPYFARCVQAIEKHAARESISVAIHTHDSPLGVSSFLRGLAARGAQALIAYGDPVNVRAARLPFTVVGLGGKTNPDFDFVTTDVRTGAKLVVEHLIKRFDSVGFIGLTRDPKADDRVLGYCETLQAHGRKVNDAWMQVAPDNYRGGYEATRKLLAQPKRPRAIFFFNDYMAVGAERAIAELGLRVPQDVAVAGFDDSVDPKEMIVPTTSVLFSYEKTARELLALIKRRIARPESEIRHIKIVPKLIVRESTRSR